MATEGKKANLVIDYILKVKIHTLKTFFDLRKVTINL